MVNAEEEFRKIAKEVSCVTIKKGMPDFISCKVIGGIPHVLFVEVKSSNGLISEEQRRVHELLNSIIPGIAIFWRPEDGNSFLNKLVPIQKRQPGNPDRRIHSALTLDEQSDVICHLLQKSDGRLNWSNLHLFLKSNFFNEKGILKYLYDSEKIFVVVGESTKKGGRKPTIFYLSNHSVQIEGKVLLDWDTIQKKFKL